MGLTNHPLFTDRINYLISIGKVKVYYSLKEFKNRGKFVIFLTAILIFTSCSQKVRHDFKDFDCVDCCINCCVEPFKGTGIKNGYINLSDTLKVIDTLKTGKNERQ